MRIIAEIRLRKFWDRFHRAESPLRSWLTVVKKSDWQKFADVKATYRTADQVGVFTVFNIGGNKYRLITVIDYNSGTVFIRHALTHEEYDRGKWKGD